MNIETPRLLVPRTGTTNPLSTALRSHYEVWPSQLPAEIRALLSRLERRAA